MEPKNLASYIAFMLIFIFEYWRLFNKPVFRKYIDFLIVFLSFFILFQTFSSLGYLIIIFYFMYLFVISILKLKIKQFILSILIIIFSLFLIQKFSDMDVFEIIKIRTVERVIGENRLYLEDFDEATLEFFISNPYHAILGAGMGNIHKVASEFLPDYAYFAYGAAWTPKAGILYILASYGLIGIFFFIAFSFLLLERLDKIDNKIAIYFKSIFLFSAIVFIFRYHEFFFLLSGLCSALLKNKILEEDNFV